MKRSLQIKLLLIIVVVLGSLWSLWPTLRMSQPGFSDLPPAEQSQVEARAIKRGLDLKGGVYLVLEVDLESLPEDVTEEEALDRTIEVLRNRIDQFGVSEPVIQKEGNTRIVVQLPGLEDVSRARELIGKTARLEFRLLHAGPEVNNLVERLDRVAQGMPAQAGADSAGAAADSTDVTDLFGGEDSSSLLAMVGRVNPNFGGFMVREADKETVEGILEREEVQRLMSRDFEFLWGETIPLQDGTVARLLYPVETGVQLAGNEIENAVPTPDPDRPPQLMVSLTLNRRGGLKFSNVTGANVGRKLAIVLDDAVISAPVIRGKIPGGRASISGGFSTDEEAQDLALMLRAGALPADVVIEEERTVGPSLGADSIRQGVQSVMIGGVLVILFMIIYYRAAGLLATGGLIITVMFLLGILAQLGLTLTLPGIAGIILTVGMAVDANVLIFERIREELRHGKSVRASIDSGYAMATRAIVDANITTFIAAVVLFYFGTGPIKGFAVTLSIGIITSMFAALVFTRSIYELWLGDRAPKSLSI